MFDFTRVCFKRCVLTILKKRCEQIFDFWFWEFLGGQKLKNHSKKLPQRLQFLLDFGRVCFKMCVLIVRNIWKNKIFHFWFWELFEGKKLEKILQKSPPNCIFSGFSADLDEILYKIVLWSPKTKSENNFLKFWKRGPGEWGGEGDSPEFSKFLFINRFWWNLILDGFLPS